MKPPFSLPPYVTTDDVTGPNVAELAEIALLSADQSGLLLLWSALNDPAIDITNKNYLASLGLGYPIGREWCLEHFAGDELCELIRDTTIRLDENMEDSLLCNPNLDVQSIIAAIRRMSYSVYSKTYHAVSQARKDKFVNDLNDELFSTAAPRFFMDRETLGLTLENLIARARVVYKIDSSFPDEWVKRMFV